MPFGKVSDYLPQDYIASLMQSRPQSAADPFGMSLEDYVNTYRQNQQPYINGSWQGDSAYTPDRLAADSWFGSAASGLELPTDASGLFSMPTSEDWRNPQPTAPDPMQLSGTGTHTNFDPNSLLGGPTTSTSGGMMPDRRWTVDISPGGVSPGPQTQLPGSADQLRPLGPIPTTPAGPGPSTFPTGTNTLGGGYGRLPLPGAGEADPFEDLFGLGPMATIPDINLGDMPTMAGGWAPGFEDAYRQNIAGTQGGIADIFNNLKLPTAQASQIDLNSLPRFGTEQVGQSDALKTLLSGQGFSPDVMARINAGATDNISRQATANRGSSRLALEQAGLAGSPAQAAIEGQINRQRGDATTQALNQNAIANADRGLENFRMGAEMDMGREMGNMQQANAMALAKASQMLTAMSQNAANVQQANMANFGAQNDRQMTSGNRQADFLQGAGQRFGDASIQKQMTADQQNAGNMFNWRLNQGNLDRGADTTNANLQQGRWNTGISGLLGLAGMQNPLGFSGQGNQLSTQQNPTNLLGSVLSNIGQANTLVTS